MDIMISMCCAKAPKTWRKMVSVFSGAVPRLSRDNGIHYRFFCQGKELDLDIRCVGMAIMTGAVAESDVEQSL